MWRSDGSRAPWARLSRTASLAAPGARRLLRLARAVTAMPATAEAWAEGEIGVDHVELLAEAAGSGRGDLYRRDEAMLVEQCTTLTWGQQVKAIRYWRDRADADLGADGTPPPPVGLRVSTGFDGSVTGSFELDPIGGSTVVEALGRIEAELYEQDQRDATVRTNAERMSAALIELAVRAHAAPAGGPRPEPLVVVLAGEASVDHICELADGTVIAPGLVVPHLSHTQLQTFVFDGADRVIAGSRQRTFRGMLRRAIQVRDRHCQHPAGCDAPIVDCDVDHRVPYTDGGLTEETDGELQCPAHNRHSDLHHRQPADDIADARERRRVEALARERIDTMIAERAERPPPEAGLTSRWSR